MCYTTQRFGHDYKRNTGHFNTGDTLSIIGVTHFVSDHCTISKVLPDIRALIRISLPQCGHFNILGFAGNIVVCLRFSKIGITLL